MKKLEPKSPLPEKRAFTSAPRKKKLCSIPDLSMTNNLIRNNDG